jgi:choline dehydrogenase
MVPEHEDGHDQQRRHDAVTQRVLALEIGTGTDEGEIDAFVREHAETALHPSCTCKMGDVSDPMAVVDRDGRVHGAAGLRVVDASIMPRIITGNLNAATIMMAEKLADVIRGRHPLARSDAPYFKATGLPTPPGKDLEAPRASARAPVAG